MPKKTDGKSLKPYRASVTFTGKSDDNPPKSLTLDVTASNIQGAVGRAARLARKQLKGRFVEATVNIYAIAKEEYIDPQSNL